MGVSLPLPEPDPPPVREAESAPFKRAFPELILSGSASWRCEISHASYLSVVQARNTGRVHETELLLNMRSLSTTPPFRLVAVPGPDALVVVEEEALI